MINQVNNQSLMPSTDVVQLTLTLKMTAAQVVETLLTVKNSPIQDYASTRTIILNTYKIFRKKFLRLCFLLGNSFGHTPGQLPVFFGLLWTVSE